MGWVGCAMGNEVVCREWGSCLPQDDSNDPPKTAPICIAIHCRNARRVLFPISLLSSVAVVGSVQWGVTLLQVNCDVKLIEYLLW